MKIISFNDLSPERIDKKSATVFGVAVCTEGPAKGHGLVVDRHTLQQLLESAESKGKIPCKLDHKSGVGQVCGYLTNFYIEADKLRANWQLLKNQPNFAHTWELIETMHDTCGLSCSFSGDAEDGFARCKDLISVDFVAHPATGNGLFSRADLEDEEDETDERIDHMDNNEHITDQDVLDLLHEALESMERLQEENGQLRDLLEQLVDDENVEDETDGTDGRGEDEEPVLDERGARRGPHQFEYRTQIPMHDFASRVETFQLQGKSQREAHIAALKDLARETYGG